MEAWQMESNHYLAHLWLERSYIIST